MLEKLTDPRSPRGKQHELVFVLTCAVITVPAGAGNYRQIAPQARDLPQLPLAKLGTRYSWFTRWHTRPSEATLHRVLQSINAQELDFPSGRGCSSGPAATSLSTSMTGKFHDVTTVKKNQPTPHPSILNRFRPVVSTLLGHVVEERSRGRITRCSTWTSTRPESTSPTPPSSVVAALTNSASTKSRSAKSSFFITSSSADHTSSADLHTHVRQPGGFENKSHHVRDVLYRGPLPRGPPPSLGRKRTTHPGGTVYRALGLLRLNRPGLARTVRVSGRGVAPVPDALVAGARVWAYDELDDRLVGRSQRRRHGAAHPTAKP